MIAKILRIKIVDHYLQFFTIKEHLVILVNLHPRDQLIHQSLIKSLQLINYANLFHQYC